MKNKIDLLHSANTYLKQFYIAQVNLNQLIYEERIQKRIQKSKKTSFQHSPA
jgi:hypothetical protein